MPTESVSASSCPAHSVARKSTRYDPRLLGGGAVVPYIGMWTGEEFLSTQVVQHASGGLGYADEMLLDRDEWGVLWTRVTVGIGAGRPLFDKLHPLRQRRAITRLLCQVCAQPADRTEQGHLWLLPEQPSYEPDWPKDIPITLPPVCLACARLSVRMCPALRPTYIAFRARSRICGVRGIQFAPVHPLPRPVPEVEDEEFFYYDDPAIRWVMATQRARTVHDCVFVDLDQLLDTNESGSLV